jgi:hypothetical protein
MKKIIAIIILVGTASLVKAQPGKYAGNQKGLINTVYTDSRNIPGLSEWTFIEGSVLTALSDTTTIMVDVYKKGTAYIVFFSIREDTASEKYTISDVLEITTVAKGWLIKTSFCQLDDTANPWIVALAKQTKTEYLKVLKKAWRFNTESRQIEQVPVRGIACLHEGFDLTDN